MRNLIIDTSKAKRHEQDDDRKRHDSSAQPAQPFQPEPEYQRSHNIGARRHPHHDRHDGAETLSLQPKAPEIA